MQILFQTSEEGSLPGLGWLPGNVVKLNQKENINDHFHKVPHIGWNNMEVVEQHLITKKLEEECFFYFAHSFYVKTALNIISTTKHIDIFPSIICKENIYGCQFHPEKSHSSGHLFLKNFIELI